MTRLGPVEVPHPSEAPACVVCPGRRPRVAVPGLLMCRGHREGLGRLLDPAERGSMHTRPGEQPVPPSIPVLWARLDARPGSPGPVRVGSGGFSSAPPVRLDVVAVRDRRTVPGEESGEGAWSALGVLLAIAVRLDARDIHGRIVALPLAVDTLSAWLYARLDALCALEWVPDAWHDLRTLSGALRALTGDPPPKPLGTCRRPVDDTGRPDPDGRATCDTAVYLPPPALRGDDQPAPPPAPVVCPGCGHVYDTRARAALAARTAREHGPVSA